MKSKITLSQKRGTIVHDIEEELDNNLIKHGRIKDSKDPSTGTLTFVIEAIETVAIPVLEVILGETMGKWGLKSKVKGKDVILTRPYD